MTKIPGPTPSYTSCKVSLTEQKFETQILLARFKPSLLFESRRFQTEVTTS